MSLYNALFGSNPSASALLKMAGLTEDDIPRYRDCYAEDGKIIVYTRTGGGNRECYNDTAQTCKEYGCYHVSNAELSARPNHLSNYDDDFDCTYAYFEFEPLADYKDLLKPHEGPAPKVSKQFSDLFAGMEK